MDTVTANVAPTTATTKNAKSPSSAPAGARRRRRVKPATGADKTENYLFALAVLDAPSDGNLHLQKPVTSEVSNSKWGVNKGDLHHLRSDLARQIEQYGRHRKQTGKVSGACIRFYFAFMEDCDIYFPA